MNQQLQLKQQNETPTWKNTSELMMAVEKEAHLRIKEMLKNDNFKSVQL